MVEKEVNLASLIGLSSYILNCEVRVGSYREVYIVPCKELLRSCEDLPDRKIIVI